jgi:hypothetical protein
MESFLKKHLKENHCFLCGKKMKKSTRSDEHIIPEWLQHEHNLWNQQLVLLNHTPIPYRQLLIPCCVKCNNEPLAKMEKEVGKLLMGSFRKPTKRDEFRLFQWCSKILYGLLHKEMSLLADRTHKSSESIVKREFLEDLTTFHHFMTSIRRPFEFVGFKPYSIFVVETLAFKDSKRNFDYFDFIALGKPGEMSVVLCLAVRVKHYGIICVFQDNGFQKQTFQDQFDRFAGTPLHPIQFLELTCKAAYKHSLLSFSPRYHSIAGESPDSKVAVLPATFPHGAIWRDWDNDTYAHVLYSLAQRSGFGVPPFDEFCEGEKTHSWLNDKKGKPMRLTQDDEQIIKRERN